MFVISLLLLTPYILSKERTTLKLEWHINKGRILINGFLVFSTYTIILFAFQISSCKIWVSKYTQKERVRDFKKLSNPLILLVGGAGFEPATSTV